MLESTDERLDVENLTDHPGLDRPAESEVVGVPPSALMNTEHEARRGGAADEQQQERLVTVTLPTAGKTLGRTLGEMLLQLLEVRVVSMRRASGKNVPVQDDLLLQGGDTLVLSGKPEALALAESKLVSGR